MARAMEIELYQRFFESNGHKKPQDLNLPVCPAAKLSRKDAGIVQLGGLVPRMNDRDKRIVVNLARRRLRARRRGRSEKRRLAQPSYTCVVRLRSWAF